MAALKVVAEYAKSGRSSCKVCGKNIGWKSLRLGLSSKDPRGFESIKWHHRDCLPVPRPFLSVEEIKGFHSLNRGDQEMLRNLVISPSTNDSADANQNSEDDGQKRVKRQVPNLKTTLCDINASEDEGIFLKKLKHRDDGEDHLDSLSDIKMNYKDAVLPAGWKAFQTVIFRLMGTGPQDSRKVAAFDFDGCLAKTSLGRVGPDEWSLMYPSIPQKLQDLYNDGFKLVVFTNESNIERWKNKRQLAVDSKTGRLENFMQRVGVPMQIFIACGLGNGRKTRPDDPFRKPNPGMWRLMEKNFNSDVQIDMKKSFYVGDAAGRKYDHSDADIEFAKAVGLRFFVPEEFFSSSSDGILSDQAEPTL